MIRTTSITNITNINVGDFREVVKIQRRKSYKSDSNGFINDEWETIRELRCQVIYELGKVTNIYKSKGESKAIFRSFIFRYFDGLTEEDRLIYKGQIYDLFIIMDYDEKHQFYAVCGKKVGNGI